MAMNYNQKNLMMVVDGKHMILMRRTYDQQIGRFIQIDPETEGRKD